MGKGREGFGRKSKMLKFFPVLEFGGIRVSYGEVQADRRAQQ